MGIGVKTGLGAFATSACSIIIGLLLSGIIIALTGRDPVAAFVTLMEGAFVGSRNIELTVLNAIPLVFTGLSVAVAFRAGLFNIGAEGQVMVSGVAAAAVGAFVPAGPVLTPILGLVSAITAAVVWVYPAAWLKARRGVHEVITTLMLSYIAFYLTTFARRYPLFDPKSTSQSSLAVAADARLPTFDPLFIQSGLGHTRIHVGVLIALAAVAFTWVLLERTAWGFEIRSVGSSIPASAAAGINVGNTFMIALCAGAALAGLGGGVQLLGLYTRISTDSFVGLGFSGFFVALIARNNPIGVVPAALFIGGLRAGGLNMQFGANVPINVVELTQGLIIIVLATPTIVMSLFRLRKIATT